MPVIPFVRNGMMQRPAPTLTQDKNGTQLKPSVTAAAAATRVSLTKTPGSPRPPPHKMYDRSTGSVGLADGGGSTPSVSENGNVGLQLSSSIEKRRNKSDSGVVPNGLVGRPPASPSRHVSSSSSSPRKSELLRSSLESPKVTLRQRSSSLAPMDRCTKVVSKSTSSLPNSKDIAGQRRTSLPKSPSGVPSRRSSLPMSTGKPAPPPKPSIPNGGGKGSPAARCKFGGARKVAVSDQNGNMLTSSTTSRLGIRGSPAALCGGPPVDCSQSAPDIRMVVQDAAGGSFHYSATEPDLTYSATLPGEEEEVSLPQVVRSVKGLKLTRKQDSPRLPRRLVEQHSSNQLTVPAASGRLASVQQAAKSRRSRRAESTTVTSVQQRSPSPMPRPRPAKHSQKQAAPSRVPKATFPSDPTMMMTDGDGDGDGDGDRDCDDDSPPPRSPTPTPAMAAMMMMEDNGPIAVEEGNKYPPAPSSRPPDDGAPPVPNRTGVTRPNYLPTTDCGDQGLLNQDLRNWNNLLQDQFGNIYATHRARLLQSRAPSPMFGQEQENSVLMDSELSPMALFLDNEDEDDEEDDEGCVYGESPCSPEFGSGQDVQRISVITQLPELLQENNADCMRRVVPKVKEVLHVAQAEMQLAACSAFLQILQRDLVPLQSYTQTFLQTILTCLDSRDPDVSTAWLETLLDVIDLLPKDVIKKDIMSVAITKGQLSQSVQSRLACCRILGKIATKFDPFVIKKDILPIVQSLCQDVDYEVRGCMCRQLNPVARGLGLEQTKSAILPELVELTNDEEGYVRVAGLETVVHIQSLLDDETCVNTIIPLVCKFCQGAMGNEDSTLPVVAKQLGKLCHGLSAHLADDQKHWLLTYYKKLCRVGLSDSSKNNKDGDKSPQKPVSPPLPVFMARDMVEEEEDQSVECRKNAAFNFPAMVVLAGPRSFKPELASTLRTLCSDPHYGVRKTISGCFHEVAKLLANNAVVILHEFVTLLQDDSIEVLKGIIPHVPETLEMFSRGSALSNMDNKHPSIQDTISALLDCESVIFTSNNWRLQEEYLGILACAPHCFTSDLIYARIVPVMFNKLHNAKALPVKITAARTLLVLMKTMKRLEHRQEVCSRLVEEFCQAASFYKRSLFIDVAQLVMQLYSHAFFKEHFFEALLALTQDAVPNIRLRLCPLLPALKRQLKLPSDRMLLQLLEQCERKLLLGERDKDVLDVLELAVREFEKIQVHMESQLSRKVLVEEDLIDRRKEAEELLLIEQEEKEKEEEARQAKEGKKKEGSKKEGSSSKIPALKKAGSKASPSASKENSIRAQRSSSFKDRTTSASSSSKESTLARTGSSSKAGKFKSVSGKDSNNSLSGGSPGSSRRHSPTSGSQRKSSANSSSSSVTGPAKGRRGSLGGGSGSNPDVKKTGNTIRKTSVGTIPTNGSPATSSRKK